MNKLLNILQSPFFIALIIASIIIFFLPEAFDKYKIDVEDSAETYTSMERIQHVYYHDLDNNGESEKIVVQFCTECPYETLIIYDNNDGTIGQVNAEPRLCRAIVFGDYNRDDMSEIYFFTTRNDSIFINVLNKPLSTSVVAEISQIYVDTIWTKTRPDIVKEGRRAGVNYGELVDLNGDGYRELVFQISSGFALQPRNLYAYDILNDTLIKSPTSGSACGIPIQFDLDKDGKVEFIGSWCNAPENFNFEYPYRDNSAWLMVFDNKLEFLFEPVEFPLFTSQIYATPYQVKDETHIAVLYQYGGTSNKTAVLYLYNERGVKIRDKVLPKGEKTPGFYGIITIDSEKRDRLYLIDLDGNVSQLDDKLDTIASYHLGEPLHYAWLQNVLGYNLMHDVDGDGEEELLFVCRDRQKLTITRNDFSHPLVIDVPNTIGGGAPLSVKLNGDKKRNLSIQLGGNWYLFSYLPNPLYYLKYLIYFGIYTGLSLFLFVTKKVWIGKLEQDKKKLEGIVEERTAEVVKQKEIIEHTAEEITASIRYAERIQNAIFPTSENFKELLPNSFVLFKPKDIVSGDFYWMQHTRFPLEGSDKRGAVLIAACDCTGHGVPGAFMSMMISALLSEAVNNKGITKPSELLHEARKNIINFLKQTEAGQKDGMDAALCAVDYESMTLEYAGAHSPLFIVKKEGAPLTKTNGEVVEPLLVQDGCALHEIKPDKHPVGFLIGEQKPFTNHEIKLDKGDVIYIFSDGYQDQFGGPRGKKFMIRRQRELLLSFQDKTMIEQKEILDRTIRDWMGTTAQVDDILMIGARF